MERLTTTHDSIHPNPWNPNKMNDRQFEAEIESIRTYGFIDPVTVRPHPDRDGEYQIIDGEHRWKAAATLDIPDLPIVVIDVTDEQAKKLTIILNETRGRANTVDLGALLAELSITVGSDDLLIGLPYSARELEELIGVGEFDWDAHVADATTDEEEDDGEFVRLVARIPRDAYEVFAQARDQIKERLEQDGYRLHRDQALALGQIIEALAAEYLAS